jgi:hypothetical protein
MRKLKAFLLADLKATVLYLAFVVFGTVAFMFVVSFIGYVPYSDRPGPGFYGWFPLRSLSDIGSTAWFFFSWGLMVVPFFAIYAVPAVGILVALRLTRVLPWVLATIACVVLGFLASYTIDGMGWYIAIALPPVIFAHVLGCLFGAWCFLCLLPRPLGDAPPTA